MEHTGEYLYTLHAVRPELVTEGPTSEEAGVLSDHSSYLERLAREGTVVLAGRTQNRDPTSFGVVIFLADSPMRAREIMEADPGVRAGLMQARLYPYRIAVQAVAHSPDDLGSPVIARRYAAERHAGQRYGDRPYLDHLDDVAKLVAGVGPEAETVAYLHDLLEDTETTAAELATRFGERVAECVRMASDEPGPNRRERKRLTYAKLADCPPELQLSLVVKAADRLANLRACVRDGRDKLLRMYRGEAEAFREAVYRPGLCEEIWEEIDALSEGPDGS